MALKSIQFGTRKIGIVGSSYNVFLPRYWVDSFRLKAGDIVGVRVNEEGDLVISLPNKNESIA